MKPEPPVTSTRVRALSDAWGDGVKVSGGCLALRRSPCGPGSEVKATAHGGRTATARARREDRRSSPGRPVSAARLGVGAPIEVVGRLVGLVVAQLAYDPVRVGLQVHDHDRVRTKARQP